jgi:hypothetical protein
MLGLCCSINCSNPVSKNEDFCDECKNQGTSTYSVTRDVAQELTIERMNSDPQSESMSAKYPKYYKPVGNLTEIDVYAVHKLFQIQDCSGAIQHASKKLLLSGARTGGKSAFNDIKEARDTLTRWLQLHDDTQ